MDIINFSQKKKQFFVAQTVMDKIDFTKWIKLAGGFFS